MSSKFNFVNEFDKSSGDIGIDNHDVNIIEYEENNQNNNNREMNITNKGTETNVVKVVVDSDDVSVNQANISVVEIEDVKSDNTLKDASLESNDCEILDDYEEEDDKMTNTFKDDVEFSDLYQEILDDEVDADTDEFVIDEEESLADDSVSDDTLSPTSDYLFEVLHDDKDVEALKNEEILDDYEVELDEQLENILEEKLEEKQAENTTVDTKEAVGSSLATYKFSEDVENDNNIVVENDSFDKELWANSSVIRTHFSFKFRVICLIIGILLLFVSACMMIFSSLKFLSVKKVTYKDLANVSYQVCKFDGECSDLDLNYDSASIDKVKVNFSYEALFNDKINYDIKYKVVLVNKVFDENKNEIYEGKDVVDEGNNKDVLGKDYKVSSDVEIDYQKYNDFVLSYSNYSSGKSANVTALLYIENGDDERLISSVEVPLVSESFGITSNKYKSTKHTIKDSSHEITTGNVSLLIVGSLLILGSLFLLFRLTKLVLATFDRKSRYELELTRIFNAYDKYLVVARGGYESDTVKKVVKVDSFDEMLNVRKILNKPIIFSKINNVKSEFLIEDGELIYKYIFKEADILD